MSSESVEQLNASLKETTIIDGEEVGTGDLEQEDDMAPKKEYTVRKKI